jgi:hypothetical protein
VRPQRSTVTLGSIGKEKGVKFRHVAQPGIWTAERQAVRWAALVDNKGVIFAVTRDALEQLMGAEGLTVEECLSTFDLHRPEIERAAERVYARGPRGERGVYLITSSDLDG